MITAGLSLAVHELGHFLTMRRYGGQYTTWTLTPLGNLCANQNSRPQLHASSRTHWLASVFVLCNPRFGIVVKADNWPNDGDFLFAVATE